MPKLRVHNFAISLDGYGAGPTRAPTTRWASAAVDCTNGPSPPAAFAECTGGEGGDEGIDDQLVARRDVGIGATIMGRNMFGPIRGP